jgi:HEAT repeat protein
MSKERFMTQTLPPERFRLVLRDLQATHDRLSGGGRTDQTAQVEAALRQLVTVNLKTLLADSAEPDPIIRDMAAFGLAFAGTEQATVRLTTMAKDASAQVRGTALIGLAILGKPVDAKIISTNLADADARVAGAAALVAGVTLKRDDPQAAALTPYIIDVLKSPNAWSRVNAMAALGKIAPAGNVSTVRALIAAGKAEKEPRLQPAYLQIMKMITGVDGKDVGAYEDWLRAQPDTAIGTKPLLPISPPHVELPGAPTPTRAPSPTPTVAPTPTAAPTSTVIPKG